MPDFIASTRAIKGSSFSSELGSTIFLKIKDEWNPGCSHELHSYTPNENVRTLSNVKRGGLAQRADRFKLPENALAKAGGVECAARFHKTDPVTIPVVDPISHGLVCRRCRLPQGPHLHPRVLWTAMSLQHEWPSRLLASRRNDSKFQPSYDRPLERPMLDFDETAKFIRPHFLVS